ncbi:chaperone protein DnaJ [Candidatus Phycosocius bacilliformis]|uniref:Chaperone protein DnaJ n=1 Tax=Candidatus Phycosocius bacilliformis TaxID=1445552 RepID=A0A2P2E9I8_9PROT|nr:J domain-containing protein [Candidatus Phycosocius bacilliformis]GBF57731.1 chaperone protein DnaJ [Candidatus Phycosocius bacilliformis]
MANSFNYRPKFVDIRVRKPPVVTIKSDVQMCEHDGCTAEATCRAPKSRDNPAEIWHFCEKHAALYNKNWNFFDGMSEEDARAHLDAAAHGGRPTWTFRASANSPDAHVYRKAAMGDSWQDPYAAFAGRRGGTGRATPQQPEGRVPAPILKALDTLGLDADADRAKVRSTYAQLVRQYHPDSNGGDRSAEARLNAVVKAYKVLKTARRA